jgi:serine/threonine protein phosphatase PrpC
LQPDQNIAQQLVQASLDIAGRDNTTAVVIKVD